MSVTENDESSRCCESTCSDQRDTGNSASRTTVSNVQLRALDKITPAVQSDCLSVKKEDIPETVATRGLTHLDLAADSVSLSTEPSSGFMLISVKHLSKVKRGNCRSKSTSSLTTRMINENQRMTDVNTIDFSSRDGSSPTTSSPMGEDEGLHNFHGSGSIEAEEFEDDELDEVEETNEDDSTTVVVSTSGKLTNMVTGAKNSLGLQRDHQLLQTNRSQVCSSTQTVSRPETPLGNRDARDSNFVLQSNYHLSPKVPQTLPSGFSLSTCDRHFEWFGHHPQDAHCMINPCEVFRYNSMVPTHGTPSFLPSLLTPHIQTNSSHYKSEVGTRSPAQNPVQTAPVSGTVSPPPITAAQSTTNNHLISVPPESTRHCPPRPYPSVASTFYDPSPSLSVMVEGMVMPVGCMGNRNGLGVGPTTASNWPNHQPGMVRPPVVRPPFDLPLSSSPDTQQQHHAYAASLPITCPLHPHSASVSDVRSSQMIAKTESNSLAAEVVAISTASLPSLQPASRFRKARIHETVEQWNHGRVSVHDCHLKVVPDWVSDLQKKAPVLDQDISTALAQRVNCLSCLEQKALDRSGLQQSLGVSTLKGVGDSYPHSTIPQSKGTIEDNHHIRLILNRGAVRNNLFSFWDGGARVLCRLPKSSRLCVPGVSEVPSADFPQQSEENNLYVEKTLTIEGDSSDMCSKQPDTCTKVAADSTCGLQDEVKGGGVSMPDNPSPAPVIFLSPNNADPATAYLRRQQVAPEGQLSYLSTQQDSLLKTGDSPSADELSLPLSDAVQSSPGSIDYANQSMHGEMPAFHLTRPVAQQYSSSDTSNGPGQDSQAFIVRKRPALDAMSVVVPPTSPTLFEGASGEPCPSGLVNEGHSGPSPGPVVNGIVEHGEPLVVVHHPKLQRLMNGEYVYKIPTGGYHNMMPTFVNGPNADPRSSSAIPSPTASLRSGIPLLNCTDTVANTALWSDGVKPVPSLVNGGETTGLQHMSSPSSLLQHPTDSSMPLRYGSKGLSNHTPCTSGSIPTIPQTKATLSNGIDHDYAHEGKLSALLSSRLEMRINEHMDSFRTAIVNTVRDELLSAYTEAADHLSEVDRLKQEVARLRGYQAAFYALRPFVSADLWEHLNSQQARLQLQQSAPSLLPMNCTSGSSSSVPTVGPAPSSIQPNSPQRVD